MDAAFDLPCVLKGEDKYKLVEETKEDCTLAVIRALSDKKERGYFCEEGLLLRRQIDPFYGPILSCLLMNVRTFGHLEYRNVETLKLNISGHS